VRRANANTDGDTNSKWNANAGTYFDTSMPLSTSNTVTPDGRSDQHDEY